MVPSKGGVARVTPIASLQQCGQSIWLDFIKRGMTTGGDLARLVRDDGAAGVTSNPTIFEKAIDASNDYASQNKDIPRRSPDHGRARANLEEGLADAAETLRELEALGISLKGVTDDLIVEGVQMFQEPFDKLLCALGPR